jgi:hypothetical protein
MAEFLEGRTTGTPLEVGTGLLTLAEISEKTEQEYTERLKNSGIDPEKGLIELMYLRLFSADYAAYTALEEHPARDAVLNVYKAHMEVMEDLTKSGVDLRQGRLSRFTAYAEAVGRQHHLGPPWTVACKFAELCGKEKDLELVLLGTNAFAGTCIAVNQFLNSVEIAS